MRRLALARQLAHIQQKDIAEPLEITASHLSHVEAGRRPASERIVAIYAERLAVSVPQVLRWLEEESDGTFAEQEAMARQLRRSSEKKMVTDTPTRCVEED